MYLCSKQTHKQANKMKAKQLLISCLIFLCFFTGAWALETDGEGCYLIGSVQDWKDFAAIVETNPTVNAKMTADIDLGNDQTHIGSLTQDWGAYSGIFDGQGHTLTVAYNGGSRQIVAPFTQVAGATIKNLHVAGSINSVFAFIGVAGYVCGNTQSIISNVWMSASMTCSTGEWAQSGTIVGGLAGRSTSVVVTDCLFTGSFTCNQNSYCGCFIGYNYNSSSAIATNCLSLGTLNISGTGYRVTNDNCYIKQLNGSIPSSMQLTDEQLADGTITTALQASRAEEVWVQNPVTNLPMLKLFPTEQEPDENQLEQDAEGNYLIGSAQDWQVFAALVEISPTANAKMTTDIDLGDDQTMIGTLGVPYQGAFDGQGHTLTVNYDIYLNTNAVAPFAVVGDALIQRLHVDGSIKQQLCAAGGVAGTIMGNLTVRECWVSAYIYVQGYGSLQGTIGGIASYCDDPNVTDCEILIEDCMFSGELGTGYHCGSIMSHVNGGYGNHATLRNCLNMGTFPGSSGSTGTFIRPIQGDSFVIDNCFYKNSFGYTQGTWATDEQLADGSIATALQADREEEVWGQSLIGNWPMLKVFMDTFEDAINSPIADIKSKEGYYTLDGIRLTGKPTQKGIYIVNGRKVVVK